MLRKSALAAVLLGAVIAGDALASDGPVQPAQAVQPALANLAGAPAQPAAPTASGVTGKVSFEGEAPKAESIDMAADPYCQGKHEGGYERTAVAVAKDGGLANVFVQLTGVPDKRYKAPDEPVELDQAGCTYHPHVFGVMKKQPIKIVNSDQTLHNIHAVPKSNKEFNVGMPTQGMTVEKEFKKAEEAIHIKCDVHPWMGAFCFSMEHPYFAVTGPDGSFTIDTTDLPDGEYGVKLWHESLGEFEGKVKVEGGAGRFTHAYKR